MEFVITGSSALALVAAITALVKIEKRIIYSNEIFKSVIYSALTFIVDEAEKCGNTTHDNMERATKLNELYKELGGDGGCNHLIKKLETFEVCQ